LETVLAFVIGGLFAAGIYMMLRRSIVKMIIGLALIAHAANLLIFTAAGLTRGQPPLIPAGMTTPAFETPPADPLPAALILTAIVISFAVIAFTMVLVKRAYQSVGSDDLDDMKSTDT
jgi:multicomponent Na+:H+ antiporter subunit C